MCSSDLFIAGQDLGLRRDLFSGTCLEEQGDAKKEAQDLFRLNLTGLGEGIGGFVAFIDIGLEGAFEAPRRVALVFHIIDAIAFHHLFAFALVLGSADVEVESNHVGERCLFLVFKSGSNDPMQKAAGGSGLGPERQKNGS